MRCARFCTPVAQIPKLLRVVSSGQSQVSVGLLFKDTRAANQRFVSGCNLKTSRI